MVAIWVVTSQVVTIWVVTNQVVISYLVSRKKVYPFAANLVNIKHKDFAYLNHTIGKKTQFVVEFSR